jgi:prevent-host-death family protein
MASLTLTETRNQLLRLCERIEREPDTVVEVTKRGRRVLALLSAERYEALVETLEILGDDATMRELRRARSDAARGRSVPWSKVKRELGLER